MFSVWDADISLFTLIFVNSSIRYSFNFASFICLSFIFSKSYGAKRLIGREGLPLLVFFSSICTLHGSSSAILRNIVFHAIKSRKCAPSSQVLNPPPPSPPLIVFFTPPHPVPNPFPSNSPHRTPSPQLSSLYPHSTTLPSPHPPTPHNPNLTPPKLTPYSSPSPPTHLYPHPGLWKKPSRWGTSRGICWTPRRPHQRAKEAGSIFLCQRGGGGGIWLLFSASPAALPPSASVRLLLIIKIFFMLFIAIILPFNNPVAMNVLYLRTAVRVSVVGLQLMPMSV